MIPVTVTARHCEIEPELRERAEAIARRLGALTPFAQEAMVVFDAGPNAGLVELRLNLAGGRILVAKGEAPEHRSALDQAEAKIRSQLEQPSAKPRRKGRGAARA